LVDLLLTAVGASSDHPPEPGALCPCWKHALAGYQESGERNSAGASWIPLTRLLRLKATALKQSASKLKSVPRLCCGFTGPIGSLTRANWPPYSRSKLRKEPYLSLLPVLQDLDDLLNDVRGRVTRDWKPEERTRYLR
jgi:hypothetical protein